MVDNTSMSQPCMLLVKRQILRDQLFKNVCLMRMSRCMLCFIFVYRLILQIWLEKDFRCEKNFEISIDLMWRLTGRQNPKTNLSWFRVSVSVWFIPRWSCAADSTLKFTLLTNFSRLGATVSVWFVWRWPCAVDRTLKSKKKKKRKKSEAEWPLAF